MEEKFKLFCEDIDRKCKVCNKHTLFSYHNASCNMMFSICCENAKEMYQIFNLKNMEQNELKKKGIPIEMDSTALGTWIKTMAKGGCNWLINTTE